jgi:large subunit ribosomal protein L2
MLLLKKKANGNSQRNTVKVKTSNLSKNNKLFKSLNSGFKSFVGRSSLFGTITSRRKGSGVKRLYRNSYLCYSNCISLVLSTLYDTKKTSFLLLKFDLLRKLFFYTSTVNNLMPGFLTASGSYHSGLFLGSTLTFKNIPVGSLINSIQKYAPSRVLNRPSYIKSAGTCGQLIKKDNQQAVIRLPSNNVLVVSTYSTATLGLVGNISHKSVKRGTAGINRRLGIRPSVRGVAMNPVDHPHGGRTNGGRPSVTPWGLPTKCGFYLKKKKS